MALAPMTPAESPARIEATLAALGAPARVVSAQHGPSFSRYGLIPDPSVRVVRIMRLAPDLALALGVEHVRVEPDADAVGLEVPRSDPEPVLFGPLAHDAGLLPTPTWFLLGRDVAGQAHAADLARMPHLLIAGSTGSGKSVMVNVLLSSMLLHATPAQLRLVLIDLKRVELAAYAGLPHLIEAPVTETGDAEEALAFLCETMDERYDILEREGARSFAGSRRLRDRIVIVVDELADLVMQSKDCRDSIIRLAQKARAAGMHLVLATQRPSTDVISGLLKANVPGRIAFAVPSGVDSRVILDVSGAEDLVGRGDMLYKPPWLMEPVRLQGAWISDAEIVGIVREARRAT